MIEINTIQDLIAFSNGDYGRGTSSEYLDVVLTTDLDFTDLAESDSPYNWNGCTGTWYVNFDGQGHKINNIYYSGTKDWGFFITYGGYVNIKNTNLTNMYVISNGRVGGLLLAPESHGTTYYATNCHLSGQLEVDGNAQLVALGYIVSDVLKMSYCSFSGVLKTANGAIFGFTPDNSSSSLIYGSSIISDIQANGENGWVIPLGGRSAITINCEYKGIIRSSMGITPGNTNNSTIVNSVMIVKPGSSAARGWTTESNLTVTNCYIDSDLLDEAGMGTPNGWKRATTAELTNVSWLKNKGFAI